MTRQEGAIVSKRNGIGVFRGHVHATLRSECSLLVTVLPVGGSFGFSTLNRIVWALRESAALCLEKLAPLPAGLIRSATPRSD